MRTQYYTATSLDGFIATVDHSLEWLFQLGDVNETSYPSSSSMLAPCHGSSTYEWMLRHLVKPGTDSGAPCPTLNPPGYSPVESLRLSLGQTFVRPWRCTSSP